LRSQGGAVRRTGGRGAVGDQHDALSIRTIIMAQWSISIQKKHGTFTFTPFVSDAKPNEPLGVNPGDYVTWNNMTNEEIELISINPSGLFLTGPIPAGSVSNPIFQVNDEDDEVWYCRVRPGRPTPTEPDHKIIVEKPEVA
jgi:hypothetical protein